LALATIFILYGLRRGLQPLLRLRNEVRSRKEGSLQLLQTQGIPSELKPLVDSFNDYIQRLENYTQMRANFNQNAAHQLRTPLTVLNTQLSDALRADKRESVEGSLLAARKTLQQTTRMVNQFLTLSSAEAYASNRERLSSQVCCDIVQKVLENLAAQAHAKEIDLGFERSGGDAVISTDPAALQEIATNLIDNAIRYTPAHGVVTVRVHASENKLSLVVEDNGPGVPIESREAIFQRFHRLSGSDSSGSGLGLAIVKELASQCAATVRVDSPAQGSSGLVVTINFPSESSPAASHA
jgi:two-component system sensor histidine kinase TctE